MKMHRSKGNRLVTNQTAESDQSGDRPAPDLSILRKSIQTSITGFTQARDVFDTGTEELKQLLTTECDVIYECKVCRNLFRSLANFISHKRVYCRQKFNTSLHAHFIHNNFIKDDMIAIIQNEKDYQHYLSNKDNPKTIDENEVTKKPLHQKKVMTKDLTSIIERLAQNKDIPINENNGCGFVSQRISNLQAISASKQAVYQNIGPDKITSKNSIQDEVAELDHMISSTVAILGPDGKIVNKVTPTSLPNPTPTGQVIQISDEEEEEAASTIQNDEIIACKICQMTFSTQKTLKFHMKHKHADNRLVYPCPDCADTFTNSWSVYRHLFKVHRKSAAHIRKLRNSIQNKAYRTSSHVAEAAKTLASAPVTDLLTDQQRLDQENQAWMDNFEGDEIPRCGGCGRRFERRAALSSHRQTCQLRIAAQNKINSNAQRRSVAKAASKEAETARAASPPEARNKNQKSDAKSEKKIEIKIRRDYNKATLPSPSKITADSNDEDSAQNRDSNLVENGSIQDFNDVVHRRNSKDSDISSIIPTIKDSDDVYVIVSTEVISSNSADGDEEECISKMENINDVQENNVIDDSDLNLEDIQRICNVTDDIQISDIKSVKNSCNSPQRSECENGKDNDYNTVPEEKISSLKDEVILNVSKSDEEIESENNRALDNQIFKSPQAPKKLHCEKCNVSFGLAKSFRKHMARHLDWKRFKCKDCGYRCFDRSQCIAHYKYHHKVNDTLMKKIQPLNSTEACSKNAVASSEEIPVKKVSPEKIPVIVELSDEETSEPDEINSPPKPGTNKSVIYNDADVTVTESVDVILELSDDDSETTVNDNSSQISRKRRKPRKPQKEIMKKKIKLYEDNDSPIKDISAISPKQEKRSANSVDPQKLITKDPSPSISVVSKSAEKSESDHRVTHSATQSDAKNVKKVDKTGVAAASCAGRRPVRNRVKPLNKDFEYDLSNLMKLEAEAYKGSHSPAAVSQKQQLKRKPFLQKETVPAERPTEIRGPKDSPVTPKSPIHPVAPLVPCRGALQEASRHASQRGKAQIKNHPSANACRHHQPFIQSLQRRTANAKDFQKTPLIKSSSEPTLTSGSTPAETTPLMKTTSMRIARRPFIASMTSEISSSDKTPPKIGVSTSTPPPHQGTPLKKLNRPTETSPMKTPQWKIKSIEISPDIDDLKITKSSKTKVFPRKISILRSRIKSSPLRTSAEKDIVNNKGNKNNSSISSDPEDTDKSESDESLSKIINDKIASKSATENNSTKISCKSNKIVSDQNKLNCVKAMKLKMANCLRSEKTLDKRSVLLPDLKFLSQQKSLTDDREIDTLSNPSFSDSDSASSFKLTVNTESICDLELNKQFNSFSDKDLIEVEYHVDAIMSDEQENV